MAFAPPPSPLHPPTLQSPMAGLSGIYSASGFDMLGVLSRVVGRPNPAIHIGPVDFSCAFVVTDARRPDLPIVYASDSFEKLTGYSNSDIVGRNCRFLQSPDGLVVKGSRRAHSDNAVVARMRDDITAFRESQHTLINYKRSGENNDTNANPQPFINLLTMIPISSDTPGEVAYVVGFQVDLVDQPQAILNRMTNGSYMVNYQLPDGTAETPDADSSISDFNSEMHSSDLMNSYRPSPPPVLAPKTLLPLASHDLELFGNADLIEGQDDLIHILSIKGLLLYVSPHSCQRLLEYQPEDIISHNICEYVHPADHVALMREIRQANVGQPIDICCRYKRKHSGWIYLEVRGHLFEGPLNKRTKCLVFSGREVHIGRLPVEDITPPLFDFNTTSASLDMTHEAWLKISPEGLVLFADKGVEDLLGISPQLLFSTQLANHLHNEADRAIFLHALQTIKSTQTIMDARCRFQDRASACFWIRFFPDSYDSCTRHIYLQLRLDTSPADLRYTNPLSPRFLETMDPVQPTSVQYETSQLKVMNKKLRDVIDALMTSSKKLAAKRKRTGY